MGDEKTGQRIWESIYENQKQINKVPQSELFTFLLTHFSGETEKKELLEIGCGVGNNLLFAAFRLGMKVTGIDYSSKAIEMAKEVFLNYSIPHEDLLPMDASSMTFEDDTFDSVIDRAALQHNRFETSKTIVNEVHRVLKKGGGYYFTATSQDHLLFNQGESIGEGSYFSDHNEGVRHFFSNHQILELLEGKFQIVKWHKMEDYNVLENVRIAVIHHVGCIKI
ncbi:class I SAM-dependent methyltransferase [Verrucomicrobia bacterium]|jgi:ubiquinone/menaquinone biosynthesis C-methylase UbiE|nr:class I SAM-dependent methyltransferase [Verrucomicrobiota bacterium]